MAFVELDSFVTKFRHLLSAGFNATLTLEAVNGKALVCLRSELGVYQPPPPYDYRHRQPPLQRGPAYWRRQGRRKAAAAAKVASEEAAEATVPVTDTVTDKVNVYHLLKKYVNRMTQRKKYKLL